VKKIVYQCANFTHKNSAQKVELATHHFPLDHMESVLSVDMWSKKIKIAAPFSYWREFRYLSDPERHSGFSEKMGTKCFHLVFFRN